MITNLTIGSDISEEWFDVYALHGTKLSEKRFANTEEGHNTFLKWALAFGARQVHVVMEHTGGCESALALFCHAQGLKVSLVDGLQVSRYRESLGRTKAKTDRNDARLIARFARERNPALWSPNPEEYRILTDLVRHRQDLVDTRKAWSCRARKASLSKLVSAHRDCEIQVLNEFIKELDKEIQQLVESHTHLKRDVEILVSIPGISTVSAVCIIAEMGPVANYKTPRDLALQAGLCPILSQSGKDRGKARLFPYGNRQLRNALYMPVISCIRFKGALAQFMERIKANGDKSNKTVITAAMRKLIQTIHGMLASQTEFDEQRFLKDMNRSRQA